MSLLTTNMFSDDVTPLMQDCHPERGRVRKKKRYTKLVSEEEREALRQIQKEKSKEKRKQRFKEPPVAGSRRVSVAKSIVSDSFLLSSRWDPSIWREKCIYKGHPKCFDNDPIKQNFFLLGVFSLIFTYYLGYRELNHKFKYFSCCNHNGC